MEGPSPLEPGMGNSVDEANPGGYILSKAQDHGEVKEKNKMVDITQP